MEDKGEEARVSRERPDSNASLTSVEGEEERRRIGLKKTVALPKKVLARLMGRSQARIARDRGPGSCRNGLAPVPLLCSVMGWLRFARGRASASNVVGLERH